ncbi:MAG: SufE family protein [Pseudomonadota bacterium]
MGYDDLTEVSLEKLVQTKGWQAQYRLIIQWGSLIRVKPEMRQDMHLIKGCELSAWLVHDLQSDQHSFIFDSDSRVMNGLVALLLSIINKKQATELAQLNVKSLLLDAGLQQYINPSRSNGLRAIILRAYTLAGCVYVLD